MILEAEAMGIHSQALSWGRPREKQVLGEGNQSLTLDLLNLSCISKEDVELAGGDTSAVFSLRERSRQETGKQESSALEDIWGLQVGYYPGGE